MTALQGVSQTYFTPLYQVAQKICSKAHSLVLYVRDTFFNFCKAISGHGIAAYLIVKGIEKGNLDKLSSIISYIHPRVQHLLCLDVYDKLNNNTSEIDNNNGLVIDSQTLKHFSILFPYIINAIKACNTDSTEKKPVIISSRGLLNILRSDLEIKHKFFFIHFLTKDSPTLVCDWNGLKSDEVEMLVRLLGDFVDTKKLIDELLTTYEIDDSLIKKVVSNLKTKIAFDPKWLDRLPIPPSRSEKDPQKWIQWIEEGSFINAYLFDCDPIIVGNVLSGLSEKKIQAIDFNEPLLNQLPPVALAIGFHRKLKCDFTFNFIEEVICPTLTKYEKEDTAQQKSGEKGSQGPMNFELILAQCLEAANEDFAKLWGLYHFSCEERSKKFSDYFKSFCAEKREGAALDFKLIFDSKYDPRIFSQLYDRLARVTKEKDLPLGALLEWTDVEYMIALENFPQKLNDRVSELQSQIDKKIEAKKKDFNDIWNNSELSKAYHLFLFLQRIINLGEAQKKTVTSFLKVIQRKYNLAQAKENH